MLADPKDIKIAVNIIYETFDANPSVNIVIGDGGNRKKKISRLASYAFVKAINRSGAFLSSNKKGVALCFRSDEGSSNLKEVFHEVRFALCIPIRKLVQTLKRESYIKKYRYKGSHLYFWFFGVQKGGDRAGFELKNYLFQLSQNKQLPILLETSVERNKEIYERFGFHVYHVWQDSGGGKPLWFMMRDVEGVENPN